VNHDDEDADGQSQMKMVAAAICRGPDDSLHAAALGCSVHSEYLYRRTQPGRLGLQILGFESSSLRMITMIRLIR
jgi:hypothetical protein